MEKEEYEQELERKHFLALQEEEEEQSRRKRSLALFSDEIF